MGNTNFGFRLDASSASIEPAQFQCPVIHTPQVLVDLIQPDRFAGEHLVYVHEAALPLDLAALTRTAHGEATGNPSRAYRSPLRWACRRRRSPGERFRGSEAGRGRDPGAQAVCSWRISTSLARKGVMVASKLGGEKIRAAAAHDQCRAGDFRDHPPHVHAELRPLPGFEDLEKLGSE